jgi:hypothetical protein
MTLAIAGIGWCRSFAQEARLTPADAGGPRLAAAVSLYRAAPAATGDSQVDGFRRDFIRVRDARGIPPEVWDPFVEVSGRSDLEFEVVVGNTRPDATARNVHLSIDSPQAAQLRRLGMARITADNFRAVSEDLGVVVTGTAPARLVYVGGYTRLLSDDCPAGCPLPDAFQVKGLPLGDIGPGRAVAVRFIMGVRPESLVEGTR